MPMSIQKNKKKKIQNTIQDYKSSKSKRGKIAVVQDCNELGSANSAILFSFIFYKNVSALRGLHQY